MQDDRQGLRQQKVIPMPWEEQGMEWEERAAANACSKQHFALAHQKAARPRVAILWNHMTAAVRLCRLRCSFHSRPLMPSCSLRLSRCCCTPTRRLCRSARLCAQYRQCCMASALTYARPAVSNGSESLAQAACPVCPALTPKVSARLLIPPCAGASGYPARQRVCSASAPGQRLTTIRRRLQGAGATVCCARPRPAGSSTAEPGLRG